MKPMSDKDEEILHVGFEGEGVTVFRIQTGDGSFAYSIHPNSQMLIEMMDDKEAQETLKEQDALSQIRYTSFEAALASLGSTVFSGYPTYVHPEFRNQIWAAYQRRCKSSPAQSIERRREDIWKEVCFESRG